MNDLCYKKRIKIYHFLPFSVEQFYQNFNWWDLFGFHKNLDFTINKFIKALIQEDKNKEFENIYILPCPYISNSFEKIIHNDWYEVILFKSYRISFFFEYSGLIIDYLKNINDGIIHIYWNWTLFFDVISFFLRDKITISHYMWWHFTWKSSPLSFIKYFIIQKFSLRFIKFFFIQNKYRIEHYNNIYKIPYKKMLFVPVGIYDEFSVKDYEKGSEDNSIILLFVWRLEKAKWILELIETFQNLAKVYNNLYLHIVWNWTLLHVVKKLAENNKRIIYLWQLKYSELLKIYSQSDIFVLPTHYDCFPSVLLEAWISGLPCISTEVEWPLSIIKHNENWILIPVKDGIKLKQALESLILDKSLRKKMWLSARENILRCFTWKKVAPLYFDTYHRLFEVKK